MPYVHPNSTSNDWQLNESGIAVWPIGAFEQHGHHLPLNTDNIIAEYFAEHVAKHFDAALLPVLSVATSLEHSGFRGSMTLTPELLMAMVDQYVDELESQNFHTLIIANGHGGNFALFPKVREINRQDRDIKIIISNIWEYFPELPDLSDYEIHAGDAETSLIMAIAPEVVGDDRRDGSPMLQDPAFVQSDLNTFGVGRMSSDGVWGFPSKATKAKGKKMVTAIKRDQVAALEVQLQKLAKDDRYGGPGPVAIRDFRRDDIDLGMYLKECANWNQLETDWKMLLDASKGGNFVAVHNGIDIGTATTVTYEKAFSWIGMVLVDPSIRRCGAGKALLNAAINYARSLGPVRLDATPEGKKLYDKLGFRDEYTISRYQADTVAELPAQKLTDGQTLSKISKSDLAAIARYDSPIFGAKRDVILKHLQSNASGYAWVIKEKNRIIGYCLGRHGSNFEQVGPIIADNNDVATQLLTRALKAVGSSPVIVDAIDKQTRFCTLLNDLGFTPQRPLIRMCLGRLTSKGRVKNQFAIAGPEIG